MSSIAAFLLVYVLGGLTFLPAVAGLFFLHAYLTFPEAKRHLADPSLAGDDDRGTSTSIAGGCGSGTGSGSSSSSSSSPGSGGGSGSGGNGGAGAGAGGNSISGGSSGSSDVLGTDYEKLVRRLANSVDIAAGCFLVTREFVPGGINGKPPERASPAGSTLATPPSSSPSVYQSMYRSLFDRKSSFGVPDPGPSGQKGRARRALNEFFVVLRYY